MYKIDVDQLDDLNSMVIVLDLNGNTLKVNKFTIESTNFDYDEIIEKSWFDTFVQKNEIEELKLIFENNIEKKVSSWNFVSNIVCKDDCKKFISWTFSLVEENGTFVIVGIGNDISINQELKSKEQMMIQQSKMAAMGEMLETIAHQWRQPLSVISTATSGIKMKKEYGLLEDEEFYSACNHIIDIVNHLSSTIDDFRNFFKPHKSKELFNLKATVEKTFSLIGSKFKNSEIEIVYNLKDVKINGFENELIQAFMVILNNAKDAFISQKDSERKLIFIDLYESDYSAVIKIRDSAGGIPPEIIHKIFNPYFTTKQDSNGTGIGLYMTEEIITKHMRGSINVLNVSYVYEDSKYNGAEFEIELPSMKKEKMELRFIAEVESCHAYKWNKEEEMFVKNCDCNDKMVLQDIATLSKFLYDFNIKFTILENQNIDVHF